MSARQKLVVVEANEIPPRIFEDFARARPQSTIARLLTDGVFGATIADDVLPEFLYPSQTWASFNTGRPYSEHKIHWYNDVKRTWSEFYWSSAAAAGVPTVLVNTLHSSPLAAFKKDGAFRFVLPDCFAADDDALPGEYGSFQRFNRAITVASGRKSDLSKILASATTSFLKRPYPRLWGLEPSSARDILECVAMAALGKSERVRNAQFPLLASIFLRSVRDFDPGLSVLFTNHVAANQHRYWYALYPNDFSEALYEDGWIKRYRLEIFEAMALLDRWLATIASHCAATDRVLIVTSSMGQSANLRLSKSDTTASRYSFRATDISRLGKAFFPNGSKWQIEAAMVPQYTFVFHNDEEAAAAHAHAMRVIETQAGLSCAADIVSRKVTLTVQPISDGNDMMLGARSLTYSDLGFERFEVDDHHSGRHHPIGSLLAWNDKHGFLAGWDNRETPYLNYAPALKEYLCGRSVVDASLRTALVD